MISAPIFANKHVRVIGLPTCCLDHRKPERRLDHRNEMIEGTKTEDEFDDDNRDHGSHETGATRP